MTKYTENKFCTNLVLYTRKQWDIFTKLSVGWIRNWEAKTPWPLMWTLFGWRKNVRAKKLCTNIHSSVMYKGTNLFLLPKHSDNYSTTAVWNTETYCSWYSLCKTASQLCDLNSGYSLHFHTFNTGRPSSSVICALFWGLRYTGKLRCNISVHQWHFTTLPHSFLTLKNTSTCHVHNFEALLFWTWSSDNKKQYSELKIVSVTEQ
jgi:hypothetical protein